MNKSIIYVVMVLILAVSCRQELFQEPTNYNPDASKFRIVKLSEIPEVGKFIKTKSGRDDFSVAIKQKGKSGVGMASKNAINFANIETDFIVNKTDNEKSYYVFNVSNAGDNKTIYNVEVKAVNGTVVDARVLEYESTISLGTNPLKNSVGFSYSGTNCGVGWGGIDLKKISPTQISWEYRPESTILDDTCPQGADLKVHLPVTKDLIFTKQ